VTRGHRVLAALILTATAGMLATVVAQRGGETPPLTVFDRRGHVVAILGEVGIFSQPAFSPDGSRIAVAKFNTATRDTDIWAYSISTGAGRKITPTSGTHSEPVWSPDGNDLAFVSRRQGAWRIYRAPLSRPATEELLYEHTGFGGIGNLWWSPNGTFLAFSDLINISSAVYVVPLDAAERTVREAMRPARFNARVSPDNSLIAYPFGTGSRSEMYVRPFDPSGTHVTNDVGVKQISYGGAVGMLYWRGDGREAYYLSPGRGVMAVQIQTTPSLRFGSPRLLFSAPSTRAAVRLAAVSADGTRFVFNEPPSPSRRQLTLTDRGGRPAADVGKPDTYAQPAISPDGTKVAVIHIDPKTGAQDIWTVEVPSGLHHVVTSHSVPVWAPVWSPDGTEVAFVSTRGDVTGVFARAWNGAGRERLLYEHTPGTPSVVLTDWSSDGRFLTFFAGDTLYVLPQDGSHKAIEIERTEFSSVGGRFSPDTRLLAYLSDRSGRYEAYVRPLTDEGGRLLATTSSQQISHNGALGMISWLERGRVLSYLAGNGALMAVDVAGGRDFLGAAPTLLFRPLRQPSGGPYGAIDNPVQGNNFSAAAERYVFDVALDETTPGR
jgi:Tol biopolymer transport system component